MSYLETITKMVDAACESYGRQMYLSLFYPDYKRLPRKLRRFKRRY